MFELSHAYSGAMVTPEIQGDGSLAPGASKTKAPATSEEILQAAREEAAGILEAANNDAQELRNQTLAQAQIDAEKIIAQTVNKAVTDLGLDLWSARYAIAGIVEQSLERMIGEIGETQACFRAVDQAAKLYASDKKLTVYADSETANRLRLVYMGRVNTGYAATVEVVEDASVEAGRCILDTGQKRIEVSLVSQIDAVKRVAQNAIQQTPREHQANPFLIRGNS